MQPEDQRDAGSPGWSSEIDAALVFGPLYDERLRIDRIVNRLDVTDDLAERADLASELVRSASRYEDTVERSLLVHLTDSPSVVLEELNQERDELREVMTVIHKRTMGIDPRNVHASDGQGLKIPSKMSCTGCGRFSRARTGKYPRSCNLLSQRTVRQSLTTLPTHSAAPPSVLFHPIRPRAASLAMLTSSSTTRSKMWPLPAIPEPTPSMAEFPRAADI
jgi:hypothetical protein